MTKMNRNSVLWMITAVSLTTAALDYATSALLAIPVLFAFPLALCAGRQSKKLLWATMGLAALQTAAATLWAFRRLPTNPWAAAINRGLILDSLLGITVLFHIWIHRSQRVAVEAAKPKPEAVAKAKPRSKRKPRILTLKQYQAFAAHLSEPHSTMVIATMCSGAKVTDLRWEQVDAKGAFMNPVLRAALARWRGKTKGTGLVFPSQDPAHIQKTHFSPVAKKLGLGTVTWILFARSYTAWVAQEGSASVHQKLLRPVHQLKPKAPRSVTTADLQSGPVPHSGVPSNFVAGVDSSPFLA
jgi:hypothetical protein